MSKPCKYKFNVGCIGEWTDPAVVIFNNKDKRKGLRVEKEKDYEKERNIIESALKPCVIIHCSPICRSANCISPQLTIANCLRPAIVLGDNQNENNMPQCERRDKLNGNVTTKENGWQHAKRLRRRGKRIICLSKDCRHRHRHRHRPNNNDFHQLSQFRRQLFQENEERSENLICILMCQLKIKLNFLSFIRI